MIDEQTQTLNEDTAIPDFPDGRRERQCILTTSEETFNRVQALADAIGVQVELFRSTEFVGTQVKILRDLYGGGTVFIDNPPGVLAHRASALVESLKTDEAIANRNVQCVEVSLDVSCLSDEIELGQMLNDAEQAFEQATRDEGPQKHEVALKEIVRDESIDLTDTGNATRLTIRYGGSLRYCPQLGWLVWDGRRWQQQTKEHLAVTRMATATVARILDEVPMATDQDKATALFKWTRTSRSGHHYADMVKLAAVDLSVRTEQLDANPMLLNVQNGTLNLETLKLERHRRGDLMTKMAGAAYDPEARCPRFLQFLKEVTLGRQGLIDYLHRLFGYCLTGETVEHVLVILHGVGFNGKSVLCKAIRAVMGDYAVNADISTFMAQRSERVRNDIARLKSARLVVTAESGEGAALDESMVKTLTGEDAITSRFLFKEHFEFVPQFTPIMSTNNAPVIRGTDEAIWGRLKLVPFELHLEPHQRDKGLLKKLLNERDGILTWMVEGLRLWKESGLQEPSEVKQATAEYRESQDVLGRFIEECCERKASYTVSVYDFVRVYGWWCEQNNEIPLGSRRLSQRMSRFGFVADRSSDGTKRIWHGLQVRRKCPPRSAAGGISPATTGF